MTYAPRFVSRVDHDAVMPVAPTILEEYRAIPKQWTLTGVIYSPQDDFQADILGQLFDYQPDEYDRVSIMDGGHNSD